MSSMKSKSIAYNIGIGLGVIFITAFLVSKLIMPLIFGSPRTILTPEIIGLELSSAKRILTEEKLHVVVKDSLFSEDIKKGVILEQIPKPGTKIKEEGAVYLTLSKGSRLVSVPNVLGMHYQEAMMRLQTADLRSAIVDSVYHDRVMQNSVVRSNPYPNTKVERRTKVRLTLSRGMEPLADSLGTEDGIGDGWRNFFRW